MTRFDNYMVDVIGEHREQFDLAMRLSFAGERSASHWGMTKAGSLVLFSSEPHEVDFLMKVGEFPMGIDVGIAADFAWEWLKDPSRLRVAYEEKHASRAPDHDGDNHAGWRVSTTDDADMSGNPDAHRSATLSGHSAKLSELQTVQVDPHGNHGIWCLPCGLREAIVAIRPWWAMYGK